MPHIYMWLSSYRSSMLSKRTALLVSAPCRTAAAKKKIPFYYLQREADLIPHAARRSTLLLRRQIRYFGTAGFLHCTSPSEFTTRFTTRFTNRFTTGSRSAVSGLRH